MLHAVLNRKLDESIPEPQRLEDALTSTVFGSLVWAEAWELVARWLALPSAALEKASSNDCWFWPKLAFAEPDVVLRMGNVLIVVEAKYRSGRHDRVVAQEGAEPTLCDQLQLQHRCIATPRDRRKPYPEPVERAIRECALVQRFIVDRGHRRARREFEESKVLLRDANLDLITWQDLFRLFTDPGVPHPRWVSDLVAYLQMLGLDSFDGIRMPATAASALQSISGWRLQHQRHGLYEAVGSVTSMRVQELHSWRAG